MKKLLLLIGFLSTAVTQQLPAQPSDDDPPITVFEENGAFGAQLTHEDSTLTIVPSTYDYVEILDSAKLIEARRYSLTPGDSTTKLPAPVIEFYNFEGNLKLRNINLLVEADKSGYYCREYQKRYFSAEMDIAIMLGDAANEKTNGRRREAYQKYMEIYRKYPNFDYAKNAADEIKASIRNERQATIAQMQREEAERQAAMQALSASLQQLGNNIGQQIAAHRHRPSAQKRTPAHGSSGTQKSATSHNSSSTSQKHTTTSARNTTAKKTQNTGRSKGGEVWCFDKKLVKCTLCNGTGKCSFCYQGKVKGRTCSTCSGSNVCKRCHGTKQIYQ